jgi:hypothetical protein
MTKTRLVVRAIACDGKFLGPDAGGAWITVRDPATGTVYANELVTGSSSGPTDLMTVSQPRTTPVLPDSGTPALDVMIDLAQPTLLEISAYGPWKLKDQGVGMNRVAMTQTVLPGVGLVGEILPDGVATGFQIQIPGLALTLDAPIAHSGISVVINAYVTMMCGCKIASTPPWPDSDFVVYADIFHGNTIIDSVPMQLSTSQESTFTATYQPPQIPRGSLYAVRVRASQKSFPNSGVSNVVSFVAGW